MSWEIFKQNILARANNPDSIKDVDTVAKLYATEYDAAIKRGGDTINKVAVKNGDVKTMEAFFKAALQKGLSSTQPYDLVGEMGKGVLAYWGTAILNEFPLPIVPSPGSTSNIAVLSNKVTVPGTWIPPQPSAALPTTPTEPQSNVSDAEDPFSKPVTPVGYPITQRVFADELEEGALDTNTDADFKVAVLKANAWLAGPRNESFSKAIGSNYGGYSGRSQSASEVIRDIYIPALNKVHADKSKGVRMLMTAQTQREGFFPANTHKWHPKASLSWITNNPGNVNTNGITIGKFATLEDGIAAQWNKVLGPVYTGQPKPSPYYKTSYTLFEYLSTYAPVMVKNAKGEWYKSTNDPTDYTNFVINYFKGQGYTITAQTTLDEINKIK